MFVKLYEKIKEFIKKEYKALILDIVIIFLLLFKLPFYIDFPGGIIDISKRITVGEKTETEGSLNFAYVSEMKATIPAYLFAKINPNWDIVPKEEVLMNGTEEEAAFIDKISYKESISNALYNGFKESNKKFNIKNEKIYVKYIFEEAKTDLKLGDQILKVNGTKVESIEQLKELTNQEEGKQITITVLKDEKEYERTATLIKIKDRIVVGIALSETYDIESDYKIDINYKTRESGPSGGLMMSLAVYQDLINKDITKGKKIVGTGTIDNEGNVGQIGGVKYKLIGAVKKKADIFLAPSGENYEEAIKIKNEKNYKIKIIGVSTLKEALDELNKI